MQVLIADDDPLVRTALESKVGRWDFAPVLASDGTEAWRALESPQGPSLAILDWAMPGMTGLEVCRRVRQVANGRYVYLILLTGRNSPEDIVEGMEAGADDYIVKPFTSAELKARLNAARRILELHQRLVDEARAREEAQKRHAEEIRQREEKLQAVLSSLHEASVAVFGPGGEFLQGWSCPELDRRSGLSMSGLVGRSLAEFLPDPAPREMMARIEGVFRTGQAVRFEAVWQMAGGKLCVDVSLSPLRGPGGEVSAVVGFMRDITEQRRMQEELHEGRKLEAVGRLASGIAHEINTPMQYAGDNTRFVQESFGQIAGVLDAYAGLLEAVKAGRCTPQLVAATEQAVSAADIDYLRQEIPAAIQQSLEGIERVTRIVRAMREFSHPGGDAKTAIDINHAIDSTITVCRNEWKYVADMQTDFDQSLPPVPCLPGELNQAILNLIINAAHAIGDVVGHRGGTRKGTITVSTRRDGDWAEIRIADTGTGIPQEVRGRIFEPFFTTKAVGKGTGQGLAIARSVVVEKHGGTIAFETEVGRGTTFIIRLPLAASKP